ncbi:hypothetical protein M409DRAFT_20131 [Zasmidium cellare ATCC 36951]|uniref:Uncharacterized protein n=1 Tax=Zasmidium cellare ATCC 36951 TaxID=1080233 RepID=A0A6A6CW39_ZASCE|nr:uncharacterized protein M409DRAFT_20131 [Zasmidium cellare ATCC 36951]KAF2169716.1 hypothetical protein M409DRAFT_20131 [Zasmidium cellare ATCC 36951]
MELLATFLPVALPCACTVALALMHLLRITSTLDQIESDPMCLAYIYISFIFYLLHSKLVTWLGNIIPKLCTKVELKTEQAYGFFSWLGTTICVTLEIATLIPFAFRALALFITAEPMLADALSERFEVAAWVLGVFSIVLFFISAQCVPSGLIYVRFTVVYAILFAVPAYLVWSAYYIASSSEALGKGLRSS